MKLTDIDTDNLFDNNPYVRFEVEKQFADTVATEQVLIHNGGHINSESGYNTFEEVVNYL